MRGYIFCADLEGIGIGILGHLRAVVPLLKLLTNDNHRRAVTPREGAAKVRLAGDPKHAKRTDQVDHARTYGYQVEVLSNARRSSRNRLSEGKHVVCGKHTRPHTTRVTRLERRQT